MSYPAMPEQNQGYPTHPGYQPPGPYPTDYPPPGQNAPGYPINQQPGNYPPPGSCPPPDSYPPPGNYPPPGHYPPPGNFQPSGPLPYPPPGQPQGPTQPGEWMVQPHVANCPPGLEYLSQIDQILVQQKAEILEAITSFESKNKYEIKNSMGQQIYYAKEETDCLTRNCCGPNRPFDMKITDNMKNEVIHLNRPLACSLCCFPCCLQSIEVSAPPGNVIGSINEEWSICTPKFTIRNASGDVILNIEGPICTMSMCGDVEFKVMSEDKSTQVGKISKQWSGFVREAFTDADHFGISFPMDLDVRMKAVLLGAVFLIDFMYFEKTEN